MAYNELIKNFNRIRDYMREFYVYGFKSREEYTRKSTRSYDNERRRLESWLGEYMKFRQTTEGKNIFISIDSRLSRHNPLYKAWKTKSFTDGDITLHFILFDLLYDPGIILSLNEIMEQIDQYLIQYKEPRIFDASTVRKKLKEYSIVGLIVSEKKGKTVYYRRSDMGGLVNSDLLDFFSEVAPCGVVGSFLLDKLEQHEEPFAFKHHYITAALDSDILCTAFIAIREKKGVALVALKKGHRTAQKYVVPLRVMISVQNGRQYLLAYEPHSKRIRPFRMDNIVSIRLGEVNEQFDELRGILDAMQANMWGVSTQGRDGDRIEHVEFTIRYTEEEQHIPKRLEREKRCGTVEHFDNHTSKFTADVFDAYEMVPWIRTFICRIIDIHFSNKKLEKQFKSDLKQMYVLYGLEDGDDNDFQ